MAVVTFSHRPLVILALGAVLGCQHPNVPPSPSAPAETVNQFLTAVNANDLQAMALLFGDERGPSSIVRENSETVRMQQMTILQRLLHGESHEVASTDVSNAVRPRLSVTIARGTRRFTVPFTLAQSRGGGWLVQAIDVTPAMPTAGSQPR